MNNTPCFGIDRLYVLVITNWCKLDFQTQAGAGGVYRVAVQAMRDIPAGEELSLFYNWTCPPHGHPQVTYSCLIWFIRTQSRVCRCASAWQRTAVGLSRSQMS